MRVNFNLSFMKLFIFIFSAFIIQKSYCESPDEIEGVLIPNKGFNSVIPYATMFLSKKQPPVVKITVAQPTLLLFPFQMSNCWGNNDAIVISDANIVKDSSGKPTNFSQVILNVKGASIVDGSVPDQTAIVCKSVDNNAYPVGIQFVEENPYSIVKFLKKEEKYSLSLDQFGFDKGFKVSTSENNNKANNKSNEAISYPKKRNIFEKLKEEKPYIIENKMIEKPQDHKMESHKFVDQNLEKKKIASSDDEINNNKSENIKSSLQKIGVFANNDSKKNDLQKNEKQKKMEELLRAAGVIAETK